MKESRALNRIEFERIVNRYLYMTAEEIVAAAESPNTPAIDLMVASIVKRAVMEGDHMRCEFILKRMIGEPPERIEDEEDEEYTRPDSMRRDP